MAKRTEDTTDRAQTVALSVIEVGKNHREIGDVNELAQSIGQVGQLQPIILRIKGAGFEVVAGHRRLAAVQQLGHSTIEAIVKPDVDDAQALQIQIVENLQREGVHPLDEAVSFRLLATIGKLEVQQIADRVGRSARYVYDRMRLLSLTAAAKRIFFEGRITPAHAVLLARLTPADQARAIDDGLFDREQVAGLFTQEQLEDGDERGEDRTKVRTADELRAWIAKHVRFEVAAHAIDDLFPEARQAITTAAEKKLKVVHITYSSFVHPDAKDGTRVYGPASWRRADTMCAKSVTGLVVVGPEQGAAFPVCVNRECAVHFGKEIRERAKRSKQAAKGGGSGDDRAAREQAAELKRREAAKERAELWDKATPAIRDALANRMERLSLATMSAAILEEFYDYGDGAKVKAMVPAGHTAISLVRHLAFMVLQRALNYTNDIDRTIKQLKPLGVDVKKILDAHAPKAEKAAAAKKAAKA